MKPIIDKGRLLELFGKYDLSNRFDIVGIIDRIELNDPAVAFIALERVLEYPDHLTMLRLLAKQNLTVEHLPKLAEVYTFCDKSVQRKVILNEIIYLMPADLQQKLLTLLEPDSESYASAEKLINKSTALPDDPYELLEMLRKLSLKYDDSRAEMGILECRLALHKLKQHKDILRLKVYETAIGGFEENFLFEEFMVELCGLWRLEEAVPGMLLKLEQDLGDNLSDALIRALGRVGNDELLRLIGERYFQYPEDCRSGVVEVLSYVPAEETETLLLDLFHKEKDSTQKTFIACALADIFSKKGIDPIIKFAETDDFDFEMTSPLSLLKTVLEYHNLEASEKLHKLEREMTNKRLEYRQSRIIKSLQKQQAVRPRKIGRNDPCPCGSGKKFKKCCMG